MAVRHVEAEIEAKLRGEGGGVFAKPSGKLEPKRYRVAGVVVLRGNLPVE